ncbi:MAG: hypothetical protein ACETWQ_18085 [Phycisphaerae bacterium]
MDGTSIRNMKSDKLSWHGKVISVQPRIRLIRSFDQRNHAYLGYSLRVLGTIGDDSREFIIGIGRDPARREPKAAQAKHRFRAGDAVSGKSHPVLDTRTPIHRGYGPKSCSFYKAGPTRKVPGRKGMSWEEED